MSDQLYLAVDRRNAFAWFSRGLILPAPLLRKYRTDALQRSGYALPLASATAAGALARAAEFPVIVELSQSVSWRHANGQQAESPVVAVHGALSANRIIRVHVPSAADAEEITARAYRGFDGAQLETRVTPELFTVTEPVDPINSIDEGDSAAAPDDSAMIRREAVAGALLSAGDGRLAPDLLRGIDAERSQEPFGSLVDTLRQAGLVPEGDDVTLLRTLLESLHEHLAEGDLVPSGFVDHLIHADVASEITGLPAYLRRITELLRGDEELRPFKPGGLLTAKALLLFLLRPEVEAVRTWDEEDLGPEPEVLLISRILAGAASRYSGLPLEIRNSFNSDQLMDWVAAGLQPNDFVIREDSASGAGSVVTGEDAKLDTTDTSARTALLNEVDGGEQKRALLVAQTMGWTDCFALHVVADSLEVQNQGRRIRAVFPEGAAVEWQLDTDRFVERLGDLDDLQIEKALRGAKPRRRTARKSAAAPKDPM